jgi:hypothetical protein
MKEVIFSEIQNRCILCQYDKMVSCIIAAILNECLTLNLASTKQDI